MKPNLLCRIGIVSFSCLLPLRAGETDLREMLRDALYTEEVSREPEKAAKQYEELLSRHDEQKAYAASALFRLAEVRRKQDRKDDAIALYQRLLTEFPNAAAETKLARENLAALGGKLPEAGAVAVDEEEKEIQRLTKLLESSPDLVTQGDVLSKAVRNGHIRVVTWLIDVAKVDVAGSDALVEAAESGHVRMIEKLVEIAGDSFKVQMPQAMDSAIGQGHLEVVRVLLRLGANPDAASENASIDGSLNIRGGRPLTVALTQSQFKIADLLIESKADVKSPDGEIGITPLFAIAANNDPPAAKYVERLIDLGADVNVLVKVTGGIVQPPGGTDAPTFSCGPLQFAIIREAWACAEVLVRRGADLKNPEMFRFVQHGRMAERDAKAISFLIGAGVSPEFRIKDGRSLLNWAVAYQQLELVKLLLAKGADPNCLPEADARYSGYNPVQLAAAVGEVEILKLLLDAGGDPNVAPYGRLLLRDVVEKYDDEKALACVKMLVEKGAVPDEAWKKGEFNGAKPKTKKFLTERFPKTAAETEKVEPR